MKISSEKNPEQAPGLTSFAVESRYALPGLRRSPAERDMQRFFGVTAPSVHQMVLALERAGLIRLQPGFARSIELLVEPGSLPRLQPTEPVKSTVQRY